VTLHSKLKQHLLIIAENKTKSSQQCEYGNFMQRQKKAALAGYFWIDGNGAGEGNRTPAISLEG
jgi:hypothetical protein